MRILTKILLLLPCFFCLTTPLNADDKACIAWVGDFDEALKRAAARNVPIFLAVIQDSKNNEKNQTRETQTGSVDCYHESNVVQASRKFVCMVACPTPHSDHSKNPCPRFEGMSCENHILIFSRIRDRLPEGAELDSPQHLILSSECEILERSRALASAESLAKILKSSWKAYQTEKTTALVKDLRSRSPGKRTMAFHDALALLTADMNNKVLSSAVSKYLKRLKKRVDRLTAWQSIKRTDSEGALSLLLPYLADRSPRVREDALEIFAQTRPVESFVSSFAKRVRKEKTELHLQYLVTILNRYSSRYPDALDHLNKLVVHRNNSIRVLATCAAARPGNQAITRELLKRAVGEGHSQVRIAAILGLGLMEAKETLPVLQTIRKKKGRRSSLSHALDLAIAKLAGEVNAGEELKREVERLQRVSGSKSLPDSNRRNDQRRDRNVWP